MSITETIYGTKISTGTQSLIRKYLTTEDYRKIAKKTGLSYSTICNIIDRRQNLTKKNAPAYSTIKKEAKRKAKLLRKQSDKDIKILSDD